MSKHTVNNKNFYLWYEEFVDNAKIKGLPHSTNIIIYDSVKGDRVPGTWSLYIPNNHDNSSSDKYPLPAELYMEISGRDKVSFDFLGWAHNLMLVSESMLEFLQDLGMLDGYDVSKLMVVNRKLKVKETEKKYFALRFLYSDIQLIDLNRADTLDVHPIQTSVWYRYLLFKNMCIKKDTDKHLFVLNDLDILKYIHSGDALPLTEDVHILMREHKIRFVPFSKTLIFTEKIKNLLDKRNFVTPRIYAMAELHKAFELQEK